MLKVRVPFFIKKNKDRPSVDSDFKTTVEKICKDGGVGTYHIFRRQENADRKWAIVSDGDAKDIRDTDPEHWLRVTFGGGEYQIRLDKQGANGIEDIIRTFTFLIDGEPKESRIETLRKKETEAGNTLEIIKTSFDMAKDMKGGNSEIALIMSVMQESSKQTTMMFTQMMEMQNKSHENMIRVIQEAKNEQNPTSELLDNLMALKEAETMISPKVERDSTIEWAKIISNNPLLLGIISKAMHLELPQGQPIPMMPATMPGSTLVPPNPPYSAKLRNGRIAEIQGNGRKPSHLSPPSYAELGSPSEIIETKHNPLTQENIQEADPSIVPENIQTDEFELNMLEPFVDAVNAGISPSDLAMILNQMIQWSTTLAKLNKPIHPYMRGFTDFMLFLGETDIDFAVLDKTYTDFCTAIEMPAELINPIKTELIKAYMPVFQQIMQARKEKANLVPPSSPDSAELRNGRIEETIPENPKTPEIEVIPNEKTERAI